MSDNPIAISLEFTPNPNSLKFVINRTLLEKGAVNFTNPSKAEKAPLAQKLFLIPGIEGILIGSNFITITKADAEDWDSIAEQVPLNIEQHLQNSLPVLDPDYVFGGTKNEGETETESKIKEILDQEIRPAVAMDGGDITFEKFEDGIVYLHLQGACSQCPSSVATLKMGVENRLKDAIPEIKEVVQI